MRKRRLLNVSLSLFDGGASAATSGAPTDSGAPGITGTPASNAKGRGRNPLADVVYGKQEVEETSQGSDLGGDQSVINNVGLKVATTSDTLDVKKAEFEKIIHGEYKDLFDARVQEITSMQSGETRQVKELLDKVQPLLGLLGSKYGVTDGSVDSIVKALENDNTFYEKAALDAGMTVEQYKRMQKVESENQLLKQARQDAERRQQADNVYSQWLRESESVKAIYPAFDFKQELQNPQFSKLLGSGVGVKAAFQALHHDEIMTGAMQYTAQTIAKRTADNVRARNQRPVENGLSSQASANVKADVSKLTAADRREIARRAARGQEVRF